MNLTPKMQELADTVLGDIENGGLMPWDKPWFYQRPINWDSKKPYNGMNVLSLAYGMAGREKALTISQFLTYNQAKKAGGQVKTGAKGLSVCFFSMIDSKKVAGERFPLMKTATVFGIEEVEGLAPRPSVMRELSSNQLGEKIIAMSGVKVVDNGASIPAPAFYSPDENFVSCPIKSLFKTEEGFYSTMFHELIHATGHKDRLDRDKKDYAFEELVAEIGGAFLASYVGYEYSTQHSVYIASWAKAMTDKKDTLFKACKLAQKAVDYLLEKAGEKAVKVEEVEAIA